jgi:hypothetical protein
VAENTSSETGTLFSVSHSGQLEEFNKVFAETETLDDAVNLLTNEVVCDAAISNLGTFVNDTVKVFPGPLEINELYCTDPMNSTPSISPALIMHKFFWRGEICVELGANKFSMGTAYVQRLKKLYLDVINRNIN